VVVLVLLAVVLERKPAPPAWAGKTPIVVLVLLKLRNLFLGPAARDTDVSLNVIRTASVVTGIEPKPAPNPRPHPAGPGVHPCPLPARPPAVPAGLPRAIAAGPGN